MFAIAMGVLVSEVERGERFGDGLTLVGVVYPKDLEHEVSKLMKAVRNDRSKKTRAFNTSTHRRQPGGYFIFRRTSSNRLCSRTRRACAR
jgi:hypothetical protein